VVRAPVLCVPAVAKLPLQAPEAVHEVAFVELHVNSELPPLVMLVGEALSATVGIGSTFTVAVAVVLVPPAPVQVSM
jgi:uncharacterized membrane protein YgaE (UPF0421/DUF939 family)